MYCRGHELRVELCKKYDIKPIGRFKLLNGKTVVSDAGNMDITDEYVIFDCTSKTNPEFHETIHCGKHVATDFCNITGYPIPTLFNPLRQETHPNSIHDKNTNSVHNVKWNETRKQLYNIVLIIITYLGNVEPNNVLFSIKTELEDVKYLNYFPKKQVKSVNTYLKKINVTFVTILDELSQDNDIRDFPYDLVLDYMNKLGIKHHLF